MILNKLPVDIVFVELPAEKVRTEVLNRFTIGFVRRRVAYKSDVFALQPTRNIGARIVAIRMRIDMKVHRFIVRLHNNTFVTNYYVVGPFLKTKRQVEEGDRHLSIPSEGELGVAAQQVEEPEGSRVA